MKGKNYFEILYLLGKIFIFSPICALLGRKNMILKKRGKGKKYDFWGNIYPSLSRNICLNTVKTDKPYRAPFLCAFNAINSFILFCMNIIIYIMMNIKKENKIK